MHFVMMFVFAVGDKGAFQSFLARVVNFRQILKEEEVLFEVVSWMETDVRMHYSE